MRANETTTSHFGFSAVAPHATTAGALSLRYLQNSTGLLSRAWRWIRSRQLARSGSRRLQVAATVSLGEKRFVAVIQVDGLQFLIGGGATNVTLLAKLDAKASFASILRDTMPDPKTKSVKRTRKKRIEPVETMLDSKTEQVKRTGKKSVDLRDTMPHSKKAPAKQTKMTIQPAAEQTGEKA